MTRKSWVLAIAGAAVLSGCSPAMSEADADNLESEIRTTYQARGAEVLELDIAVIDSRTLGGPVRLRDPATGEEVTNDCHAELPEEGREFQWTCTPAG